MTPKKIMSGKKSMGAKARKKGPSAFSTLRKFIAGHSADWRLSGPDQMKELEPRFI